MNVVKLVSGGVDSYIMAQTYPGTNVYVDFGQKYAKHEKAALRKLGVVFDEITVTSKFKESDVYIPDRNLFLVTLVAMAYEPRVIMLAGLRDDNCTDKTPEAFRRMSEIVSEYANHRVEVVSPFFSKTKGEIVYQFIDKEKLKDTFSCYNPGPNGEHCGKCPACLRKAIALETNGIDCGYEVDEEIVREYLSKIHSYDTDRISRFFIWLKRRKPVYAIDLDGVLCKDEGPYMGREPNKEAVLRLLKANGYIVIYTARLDIDRAGTEYWLAKNGVRYDALITNKLPFTSLIDDRARTMEAI